MSIIQASCQVHCHARHKLTVQEEAGSPFEPENPTESFDFDSGVRKAQSRHLKTAPRYSGALDQGAHINGSCESTASIPSDQSNYLPEPSRVIEESTRNVSLPNERTSKESYSQPPADRDSGTCNTEPRGSGTVDTSSTSHGDVSGDSHVDRPDRSSQPAKVREPDPAEFHASNWRETVADVDINIGPTLVEEGKYPLEPSIRATDGTSSAEHELDVAASIVSKSSSTGIAPGRSDGTRVHEESSLSEGDIVSATEVSQLQDLYCNYAATKHQFVTAKSPVPIRDSDEEDLLEQTLVYNMSKNQQSLVEEEEQIWNRFLFDTDTTLGGDQSGAESSLQSQLFSLEMKSSSLATMLERRRPPDEATYKSCKHILRAMGVPCLESPEFIEGEAFAAALVHGGRADFVASEDTDVIIYEAPLLRGLGSRSSPLLEVDGAQVRAALELQRKSFIDLALLCGTDFSKRIKNIGPNRALKLIREFHSIENVLEDPKLAARLPNANDYLEDIAQARLVFMSSPPMPADDALRQGSFDASEVQSLLQQYGLTRLANTDWFDTSFTLSPGFDEYDPDAYEQTAFGDSIEGLFDSLETTHSK